MCDRKYCNANEGLWQSQSATIQPATTRGSVLRALFIALSESRSLRAVAERSRLGQRVSTRFVAGTEVADAIRATAAMNQIGAHKLNANVSVKLTHMGLDVDEKMAYEIVRGLVAKAAGMSPKNFIRVDMEGSAYTQRTLPFVHELHRVPGNAGYVGTVIQSYM